MPFQPATPASCRESLLVQPTPAALFLAVKTGTYPNWKPFRFSVVVALPWQHADRVNDGIAADAGIRVTTNLRPTSACRVSPSRISFASDDNPEQSSSSPNKSPIQSSPRPPQCRHIQAAAAEPLGPCFRPSSISRLDPSSSAFNPPHSGSSPQCGHCSPAASAACPTRTMVTHSFTTFDPSGESPRP